MPPPRVSQAAPPPVLVEYSSDEDDMAVGAAQPVRVKTALEAHVAERPFDLLLVLTQRKRQRRQALRLWLQAQQRLGLLGDGTPALEAALDHIEHLRPSLIRTSLEELQCLRELQQQHHEELAALRRYRDTADFDLLKAVNFLGRCNDRIAADVRAEGAGGGASGGAPRFSHA